MKTTSTLYTSGLLLALLHSSAVADDWPQWRGPSRNGISKETGLLKEWPKDGPKLNWKISSLGSGYSTPAVAGKQLFLLGNEGLEKESVAAFDTESGRQLWSVQIGKVGNPQQQPNFASTRSTPTIDGNKLYALGSDGDLVCVSIADGKIIGRKT